jgi:hypothetical protein
MPTLKDMLDGKARPTAPLTATLEGAWGNAGAFQVMAEELVHAACLSADYYNIASRLLRMHDSREDCPFSGGVREQFLVKSAMASAMPQTVLVSTEGITDEICYRVNRLMLKTLEAASSPGVPADIESESDGDEGIGKSLLVHPMTCLKLQDTVTEPDLLEAGYVGLVGGATMVHTITNMRQVPHDWRPEVAYVMPYLEGDGWIQVSKARGNLEAHSVETEVRVRLSLVGSVRRLELDADLQRVRV